MRKHEPIDKLDIALHYLAAEAAAMPPKLEIPKAQCQAVIDSTSVPGKIIVATAYVPDGMQVSLHIYTPEEIISRRRTQACAKWRGGGPPTSTARPSRRTASRRG